MEKLYAPWRSNYVTQPSKETENSKKCIFCEKIKSNDDKKNFILARYPHCFIMMNLYPYNAGHLMIIPNKHTKDLKNLSSDERIELMNALSEATDALNKTLKPDGINIGINIGKAAGAGIPNHLHIHVLPRWEGDTNFMPLLAETKHISTDLNKIYDQLKKNYV